MKILNAIALACPLFLLAYAFSVKADEPAPAPERGSRVIATFSTDLDGDQKNDSVLLREHAEDDGLLDLVAELCNGKKVLNPKLVYALDRDESDVSTYGISLSVNSAGSLVIEAVKDWGTSNLSNKYVIAHRNGELVVAGYDYAFSYREKGGSCSLNLLTGKAIVNGRTKKFEVPKHSLADAEGLELLKLCQDLGAN